MTLSNENRFNKNKFNENRTEITEYKDLLSTTTELEENERKQ